MSFDVSPLAGSLSAASAVDRVRTARGNDRASFGDAVAGAGSTPPIPAEVWDQVDAASRLAENLQSQGRSVRFDVHKLSGGVVASLVDDEEGLLRPLLLEDVIDPARLSGEVGKG